MNKYNNPRLLNTVVSGTGMKNPVRPHVIIGSEKNGFIRGDLMDANAVKEAVEKEVAERIDADLNLSEEIDTKVRQAVDDLVDGAPEVLDTLKELSEAIGDDENFITTMAEHLSEKVDKVEGKDLSTNDYSNEDKAKLAGIAEGAEVNVQSDWNQTNSSNDAFIKNKPTKLSQFENDALYATTGELQNVKSKYVNPIYKKTPDLYDILYSDGTISTEVISDKTPVAICVDDGTYFNDGIARFATGIIAEEKWSVDETDTNATSHTDGKSNTNALTGLDFPAAAACINYHPGTHDGEWYLPASDELRCMYEKLSMLRHTYEHCGMGGLPSALSSWSSTQTSTQSAIVALDNQMIAMSSLKTSKQKVIAFLTISTFTESGKIVDIESVLPKVDIFNGHEYVDLGLPSGTLWATCNVGSHSPEQFGDYYMYGMGSKTYDAADTPYDGTEDPLDLSRDTARQVMGGAWHMPTAAQMQELTVNTTYRWATNYKGSGINGGIFTGTNGAVLFLPAAGFYDDGPVNVQSDGCYWSSSPLDTVSNKAYFYSINDGSRGVDRNSIEYGLSVRGVINHEDVNKTFVPVASKDEVQTNEKVVAAALNDLNLRIANRYTDGEKIKLASVEYGAEKNVQSDWNVTSTSSDAYIKNKPAVVTQSQFTQQINQLSNTINSNIQDLETDLGDLGTALEDDEYVLAQAITTLNTKLREANIKLEDINSELEDIDAIRQRTIFTPTPADTGETIQIFDGSSTIDELEDLVTNTNTRKFLTTVRGNKTLIVGFVDFFTDWAGHQITAVATSNIHLDEWDNESDLTLVTHTDGKANVYVAYCGLHDPAGYSGLVEGEWTPWKKFNTDVDDLRKKANEIIDRSKMPVSTFQAIFTDASVDDLKWIINNYDPVFYIMSEGNTSYPVGNGQIFASNDFSNITVVVTTPYAYIPNFSGSYASPPVVASISATINGDNVSWNNWVALYGNLSNGLA